jgi:hypothetical protein
LPVHDAGGKKEKVKKELLYYTSRPDELPESAPDIAFLLGESSDPLSLTAASMEEEKPIRLLHDWVVFDVRPSKAKAAAGALALELISLLGLDDASDSADPDCAPEGAGAASPYFENEEDVGQEDDGDYDDDDTGGDEGEGTPVSVRLRLGALLRYTIDYTKRDEYVSFSSVCTGVDVDIGIPARYTSRQPWLGTSSASRLQSTALSSHPFSMRTESHRSSCARFYATQILLSTRFSLSSSSRTA